MTQKISRARHGERGNVLFLILIAVALFAALSYAVTQSTRSGGGNAADEGSLINAAAVTQYPAGVRTALVRMVIGGTDVQLLEFNSPANFGDLTLVSAGYTMGVFHPDGGGATYQQAPPEVMANAMAGTWRFNAETQIENIGVTNAGGGEGNDLVAFLPGVARSLCVKTNEELGINITVDANSNGIPDIAGLAATDTTDTIGAGAGPPAYITFNTADGNVIAGDMSGQPFGCFDDTANGNQFVYYHVLLER